MTGTGDTRFDRVLDVRKQARELPFIERFLESKEGKRPIVMVAGSSWPQDEAIFIPYFLSLIHILQRPRRTRCEAYSYFSLSHNTYILY